jgi:antitoxin ParD1/3/4
MATMNISLPAKLKDWVEAQVATGNYANASDYIRDLLRDDQEKGLALDALHAEIKRGLDSGPPVPFDPDEIYRRATARYAETNGKAAE